MFLPHGLLHGAEVDRQVRGVRHQTPRRVEHGAGEVEPLLDVDADRGTLGGWMGVGRGGTLLRGERSWLYENCVKK